MKTERASGLGLMDASGRKSTGIKFDLSRMVDLLRIACVHMKVHGRIIPVHLSTTQFAVCHP